MTSQPQSPPVSSPPSSGGKKGQQLKKGSNSPTTAPASPPPLPSPPPKVPEVDFEFMLKMKPFASRPQMQGGLGVSQGDPFEIKTAHELQGHLILKMLELYGYFEENGMRLAPVGRALEQTSSFQEQSFLAIELLRLQSLPTPKQMVIIPESKSTDAKPPNEAEIVLLSRVFSLCPAQFVGVSIKAKK